MGLRNYIDNGHNGIAHSYYVEEDDKGYMVESQTAEQNQQVLDNNAKIRGLDKRISGFTPQGKHVDGVVAAQIPLVLYLKLQKLWQKEYSDTIKWVPFLVQVCNSREYSLLKTVNDKIPVIKEQVE